MNHAIKIEGYPAVIVTFSDSTLQQLTPEGLQQTDGVTCFIEKAEGLDHLGSGSSLRSQSDSPDQYEGYRLALKRAAKEAFPFDKAAQDALRQKLFAAFPKPTLTEEEQAELQTLRENLQIFTQQHQEIEGRPQSSCSVCNKLRAQIATLERKAA